MDRDFSWEFLSVGRSSRCFYAERASCTWTTFLYWDNLSGLKRHYGRTGDSPIFGSPSHGIFSRHRNPMGKTKDSLEIVNQRGSFSWNILKSIFFWLRPFLALIFEFNITNHFLIGLWIDFIEGNGQKSSLENFCWVIKF